MARSRLQGAKQLQSRLEELRTVFKPIGKEWGKDTAERAGNTAPRRTGKLARSFKVRSATEKRANVVAIWYAKFLNVGTRRHTINAKGRALIFEAGGNTIFAKKVNHPPTRGTRFVDKAAHESLRKNATKQKLIDAWNRGA